MHGEIYLLHILVWVLFLCPQFFPSNLDYILSDLLQSSYPHNVGNGQTLTQQIITLIQDHPHCRLLTQKEKQLPTRLHWWESYTQTWLHPQIHPSPIHFLFYKTHVWCLNDEINDWWSWARCTAKYIPYIYLSEFCSFVYISPSNLYYILSDLSQSSCPHIYIYTYIYKNSNPFPTDITKVRDVFYLL